MSKLCSLRLNLSQIAFSVNRTITAIGNRPSVAPSLRRQLGYDAKPSICGICFKDTTKP